jgi:hypothetical protein
MRTIKVKPVEGRLILRPEADYKPIKEEITVYATGYYLRAVKHGDLEQVSDEPATPPAAPTDNKTTADTKVVLPSMSGQSGPDSSKPNNTGDKPDVAK